MIVCGALVVPPTSTVYTPQELAHKRVALDYGNGTAYAGLQMLEGAMPREAVTTCAGATSPAERFAGLMRRDFEATVLQEPWITVAEKVGCRLVSTTFFHGTWVATRDVNVEAYAALCGRSLGRSAASTPTSDGMSRTSSAIGLATPRWKRSNPTTSTWGASS